MTNDKEHLRSLAFYNELMKRYALVYFHLQKDSYSEIFLDPTRKYQSVFEAKNE